MSNTQQLSQAQSLPLDQAINNLIAAYEADAEQSDQLIGELERVESENTFLKLQISTLTKRINTLVEERDAAINKVEELVQAIAKSEKDIAKVIDNAQSHMQMLEQAKRQELQAKNKAKDLEIQLKAFKAIGATPKKIRDKIKDYQARIQKEKGFSEQHKKNFATERKLRISLEKTRNELAHKLAVSDISQCYSNGDDIIALFPHKLGEGVDGYEAGQIPLLYMHRSGRGGLILINEDNEAELVSAPKGGLRPKKQTLEHCSQLLRRFKSQGWTLTDEDVRSIALKN